MNMDTNVDNVTVTTNNTLFFNTKLKTQLSMKNRENIGSSHGQSMVVSKN